MRISRGTPYVRMGDRLRRRRRTQRALIALGLCVVSGAAWAGRGPVDAHAESSSPDEVTRLRGELDLAHAQLDRWHHIYKYSSRYNVGADLATAVYDIALAEGIEPELAFRLVKLESNFNERATSPVGAVGLTQLMLPTAQYFHKGITKDKLYGREVNLRIGFRYLRALIREHKGNTNLALLVYNRGPVAVSKARQKGENPSNGYDRIIMKGYQGRTTVD